MASECQRLATFHDKSQTSILMLKLNEQRKLSRFCDVVLKVCGEQIFAHSNILASASDYFGSFLGCGQDWPRAFSQKTPQIIEIYIDGNDGDSGGYGEAVRKVVDFMYTSKIDITLEVLNQVSEIAKIMQMNKILEYCESFQKTEISGQVSDEDEYNEYLLKVTVGTMTEYEIDETNNDNADEAVIMKIGETEYFEEDDRINDPDYEAIIREEQHKKRKRGRPKKKTEEPTIIEDEDEVDENLCIFFQDEDSADDIVEKQPNNVENDVNVSVAESETDNVKENDLNSKDKENKVQENNIKSEPKSPKPRRCSKRIRKAKERPDYITHSIPDLNKVIKVEAVKDEHQDVEHVDKIISSRLRYMCKQCNFICKTMIEYKSHKTSDHTEYSTSTPMLKREFVCDKCDYTTRKQQDFKEHSKNHLHTELRCSFCDYQAENQIDFDQHFEKHSGEMPYFCMICDLKFKNKAQYNAHMPKHSEVKPFVCDLCDSGFKWKHALKSHMITHSDTKDHLCDICGFATAHKSMLKAHKLIHSGNTYKCQVLNCTFQATKKQNLKYHMLTHSGEKPHQCEICGQSFSLVKNMKRHKLMHSTEKPLRCDIEGCQFGTTRYDKLKEHKLKQHGSGLPPTKKLRLVDYQTLNENQIIHFTEGQILNEALAATQNIQEGQIIATVDSASIIGTVQYAEIDNASGIIQYVTTIE